MCKLIAFVSFFPPSRPLVPYFFNLILSSVGDKKNFAESNQVAMDDRELRARLADMVIGVEDLQQLLRTTSPQRRVGAR